MISMASTDVFGGFTAFSAKNILVVIAGLIRLFLVESSIFFSEIKVTHLCLGVFLRHFVSKDITLLWWFNELLLFSVEFFFICSLKIFLIMLKKHKHLCQNSNYTDTKNKSIIRSCGKSICKRRGRGCRLIYRGGD